MEMLLETKKVEIGVNGIEAGESVDVRRHKGGEGIRRYEM